MENMDRRGTRPMCTRQVRWSRQAATAFGGLMLTIGPWKEVVIAATVNRERNWWQRAQSRLLG